MDRGLRSIIMPDLQIVLGLLLAVVALTTAARWLKIAYPVLLVVGGLILGFIPEVPHIVLSPDLVFLLFLPALLYWEALQVSYRDLRYNIRPITSLAVGLVLTTIVVVAVVAHAAISGFSWAAAFVLGTIVAPTDETAATAIADRLPLPARLQTIIEDESLLNDASSLVAYNVAVAAVVTGSFSLSFTAVQFVVAAVGGVAVGLVAAWLLSRVRRRLYDPPVENTISLLSGFVAYLPASALGLSGVLAVVAEGLCLGRTGPRFVAPRTRLQNQETWEVVNFLLNGLLFILVGLQLHGIIDRLSAYQPMTLLGYAALVSLVIITLRIAWVFSATYLPRTLFPRWAVTRPDAPWQETAIVAWTGMRGAVSLAAALAVPLTVRSGGPFPDHDLIVFLTFAVILATLVLQGLTLPILIQRLGVVAGPAETREEMTARRAATRAGLQRLKTLPPQALPSDLARDLRNRLRNRDRWYADRLASWDAERQARATRYRQALEDILDAEREAVINLRDQGTIGDEAMRRVLRDLDLEEVELED